MQSWMKQRPFSRAGYVVRAVLDTMDASDSMLDDRYMNLPHEEALEYMLKLKSACRKYAGVFGLLWHNTRFVDPAEVELYRQVLEG